MALPPSDDPADQLRTTTYGVLNGVHTQLTAAAIKSSHPANSVYTFAKSYTFSWRGAHLQYRRGQSYHLDAALKAALLAVSAPMTAA
jgi:hypothetical protein